MSKTIDDLIQDLKDTDDFVREETFAALEMRAEESLDSLIEALNNGNKNIKMGAAKVLGFIGDPKAIEPLINTLSDKNKLVRREASTALTRMGDIAVDPLIRTLNNEDWRVRGAAAWALGGIKNNKAIEYLEPLLEDTSGFVRAGAKNALNKLNII